MSTFLELVNAVERESGTVSKSQRLATVAGAPGRQEKIVEWTSTAWVQIQRARPDWAFMRAEASHELTVGQARYAAADLGVTDFAGWRREADGATPFSIYDPAYGRADENRLHTVPFAHWRDTYDIGVHDALRPSAVAVDDQRRLCLGPTPDKAYILRFGYRRSIQRLTDDDDVPVMPDDHHEAIVWLAITLLAEHDEAGFQAGAAMIRYRDAYSAMVRDLTPEIEL